MKLSGHNWIGPQADRDCAERLCLSAHPSERWLIEIKALASRYGRPQAFRTAGGQAAFPDPTFSHRLLSRTPSPGSLRPGARRRSAARSSGAQCGLWSAGHSPPYPQGGEGIGKTYAGQGTSLARGCIQTPSLDWAPTIGAPTLSGAARVLVSESATGWKARRRKWSCCRQEQQSQACRPR